MTTQMLGDPNKLSASFNTLKKYSENQENHIFHCKY